MLRKVNAGLRKIGIPLNIINVIVGLMLGVAYVYVPFASIGGLILGILMAVSGSSTMAISYYFTSKNSQQADQTNQQSPLKHTAWSTGFLLLALPMILLNAAASFFGMYTSIFLLASAIGSPMYVSIFLLVGAIGIPLGPPGILAAAIVLASILTVGTIINSWLQAYNIWESLKEPEVHKTPIPPPASIKKTISKISLQPIPVYKPLEKTFSQKISGFFGGLFTGQTVVATTPLPKRASAPPELGRRHLGGAP